MFANDFIHLKPSNREELLERLYNMREVILDGFGRASLMEEMKVELPDQLFSKTKQFSENFQRVCFSPEAEKLAQETELLKEYNRLYRFRVTFSLTERIESPKVKSLLFNPAVCGLQPAYSKAEVYVICMRLFLKSEIDKTGYGQKAQSICCFFDTFPDVENFLYHKGRKPTETSHESSGDESDSDTELDLSDDDILPRPPSPEAS